LIINHSIYFLIVFVVMNQILLKAQWVWQMVREMAGWGRIHTPTSNNEGCNPTCKKIGNIYFCQKSLMVTKVALF